MEKNWLEELINFYDFIWEEGINACGKCINQKILEDFQSGGNNFETMKKAILRKFPTEKSAKKAYNQFFD